MERRIALSIAAAAAIALTTGGAALAANIGLLGADKPDTVGELSAANVANLVPTTTTPSAPGVVVIEEVITVPGRSGAAAGSPSAPANETTAAPQTRAGSPAGAATAATAADGTPLPTPEVPTTVPGPGQPPGPGWEWDDDDQRWELEDDDDDDYDDDDYEDDDYEDDDDYDYEDEDDD